MNENLREQARDLRRAGVSHNRIAKQLSLSNWTVYRCVKDIVLSEEQKKRISNIRQKEGEVFFNLPIEQIEQMIMDGLNQEMMAKKFGVLPGLVGRSFRDRGILDEIRKIKKKIREGVRCKFCGKIHGGCWQTGIVCPTCVSKIRRMTRKIMAIKELGGKCQRCGWKPTNREVAAMEFHHKGVGKKEFAIGDKINHKWETILPEIRKCELLCARCHRIEHSRKEPLFDFVFGKEDAMAEGLGGALQKHPGWFESSSHLQKK